MRVGAAAIAMLLLALMSITIPALSGDGGSVLAQSSDALDRYTGRSPGERGETDIPTGQARRIADRLFGRRVTRGDTEQRATGKNFHSPPHKSINKLYPPPDP